MISRRLIISCLVFSAHLLGEALPAEQAAGASKVKADVGREDPFGQLLPLAQPLGRTTAPTISVLEKPELSVETVTLKFLDAKNLEAAIGGMSSEFGTISVDPTSNSLIICDTKDQIAKILAEVREADKTPPQIVVEVVIADVQLSDDTEIGINWDLMSDKYYDVGYRQNFTDRLGSTIEDATNIGNATAFNTTGTGGNFSVISGTIRNVLSLLQEKKDVEILASPQVMVVSGKTASIKAVEELPYNEVVDTSMGGSMSQTKFKEVGVTLEVGATLTDDNHIHLTVDATQNVRTGETSSQVPVVDTRNARSELLLKDGQVVVVGGLRRKETTREVTQIPILGDLPLIGGLFRSVNVIEYNSELIAFISPHVYKGEPISQEAMAKFKQITEMPTLSVSGSMNASHSFSPEEDSEQK